MFFVNQRMNKSIDKPYNLVQKVLAYIKFLHHSKNRHGVHSPFVYDFIENVLNPIYIDREIENERKKLLKNNTTLFLKDYGQGYDRETSIAKIASASLKKPKEAQILSKIASHYSMQKVIELGTSFGISSAYLSKSTPSIHVSTIEGSKEVLDVAKSVWSNLNIQSIHSINSDFDSVIDELLNPFEANTLYFLDGNHRFKPSMKYFQLIKEKCHESSILILDDIHWSPGMEKAWNEIIALKEVTLSIDLFELGIVFFKKRLKKEHFILRY